MTDEYFAYKHQSYSLSAFFGSKEGREKFSLGFFVYAFSIVGNDYARWVGFGGDGDFSAAIDALNRIFNDVYEYLFK